MEQSVHGMVLDLRDIHNPRHLNVKQGDTGVRLCVALTDGGKPYRLTPDCYGVFTAKKPDGTCIFNRCTTENGRLVYDFTPQTTAAPGDLDCQLKLYGKNDRLLTTAAFTVTVHETVYNEGDTLASETEVTALTRLISQTTDLVDTVQTKLDTGEFHGKTPHIGENGNWFLGETDTGIAAGTLDDSRVSEATTWSSRKLQNTFVRTDAAQTLTQAQMARVRENIGAMAASGATPLVKGVHIEEKIPITDTAYGHNIIRLKGESALVGPDRSVLRICIDKEEVIQHGPEQTVTPLSSGKDIIFRGILPGIKENDAVSFKQFSDALGDVESALDSIIALQNSLIGGGNV